MANTKQGIYYQDNYSSVADVPNDMKKMAESVDAEIGKDRERLTKNESDIKNIQDKNATQDEEIANINEKDTAQDTNIETLTKRLNEKDNQIAELEDKVSDLNNNQIYGQASGEYVHLVDSAKMECSISPRGNSKQETSIQNENILDLTKQTITEKVGCTITDIKANEITISTQNSANLVSYVRYKIKLNAGKWYFKKMFEVLEGTEGSTTGRFLIQKVKDWSIILKLEKDQNSGTFTLTEDTELYVSMESKGSTDSFASIKVRFYNMMFSKSDVDYVPFIPDSPSLDYPSEIETVGDNVNLFDENGEKTDKFINSVGAEQTGDNGDTFIKQIFNDDIATNYIMSFKNNYGAYVRFSYFNNETFISREVSNEQGHIFTVPGNCTKIDVRTNCKNVNSSKYFEELKIEKGTVATTYSSYGCGSANVKVWNKNLLDLIKENINIGGFGIEAGYISRENNEIVINQIVDSQSKWATYYFVLNKKLIGKKVSVSFDIKVKNFKYIVKNRIDIQQSKKYRENSIETLYNSLIEDTYVHITTNEFLISDEGIIAFFVHTIAQETEDKAYIHIKNFQIEENSTATDYIAHEEQNYPVDMQEPFRAIEDVRDCFVLKDDDKWYERHKISRKIFDGTENWQKETLDRGNNFYLLISNSIKNKNKKILCNNGLYDRYLKNSGSCYISDTGNLNFLCKEMDTLDNFKAWIKSKYEAGTPIYIDYQLATPIDIECTEAQTQQLQALQKAKTYKNITNITTDTIAVLDVDYKRDLETIINNMQAQILAE